MHFNDKYGTMSSDLINMAKELGFIAIGFSRPERPLFFDRFSTWVSERKNAGMSWIERNLEIREDPTRLLKGCRTIISLAYPYPLNKPATPDGFTISRYCRPYMLDYHQMLKGLCHKIVPLIENMDRSSRTRICVDSAPILEKSYAYSAGMGFFGKNNLLIIPGHGSYLYLSEIMTTADIDFFPVTPMENQCGSCSLCIDSCPTGALERPFFLDASRCLSYLTTEHNEPVAKEEGENMGDCFLGCDRCQEVCPFNQNEVSRYLSLPSAGEFLVMSDDDFNKRFGKTALSRAGLEKIKSNIQAIFLAG